MPSAIPLSTKRIPASVRILCIFITVAKFPRTVPLPCSIRVLAMRARFTYWYVLLQFRPVNARRR
jgi:hypothetical protein